MVGQALVQELKAEGTWLHGVDSTVTEMRAGVKCREQVLCGAFMQGGLDCVMLEACTDAD